MDRDLGIIGAIALGVGTMIAAGIFVLSGLAVSNVGEMAIVAFLIAAIVASFTAFAYAEFASIYPESGGGYVYVANTFDSNLTYIVGWSMILGYPASAAFYLTSFSDWFDQFIVPLFSTGLQRALPFWISGLVILGLLIGLNLKGTEESGQSHSNLSDTPKTYRKSPLKSRGESLCLNNSGGSTLHHCRIRAACTAVSRSIPRSNRNVQLVVTGGHCLP